MSNREVADQLYISENTVKNHVRNILEKLHLHSRMEAVMYAVRKRLLDPHLRRGMTGLAVSGGVLHPSPPPSPRPPQTKIWVRLPALLSVGVHPYSPKQPEKSPGRGLRAGGWERMRGSEPSGGRPFMSDRP